MGLDLILRNVWDIARIRVRKLCLKLHNNETKWQSKLLNLVMDEEIGEL